MQKSNSALTLFCFFFICFVIFHPILVFAQSGEPSTILTPHDTIPNPCHTSVYGGATTITAAANGNWSASGSWNLARPPIATDIVFIPAGRNITVDNTGALARTVCVHGTLQFRETANTSLLTSDIVIFSDGTLQIGTTTNPIDSGVSAQLILRDQALNTTNDPAQYLTAFIALGRVQTHGTTKNATFVRLSAEAMSGQSSLSLSQPVSGWASGDRLIIPGSNQMPESVNGNKHDTHNFEERNLVSINGNSLTLNSALTHTHPGSRNLAGTLELLPHVGNLTRNVTIRSQTLAEAGKPSYCTAGNKLTSPSSCATRGHVIFTGRGEIDVRYTAFRDLGRTLITTLDSTTFNSSGVPTHIGTNQIGRYPIHAHHLSGPFPTVDPDYQFRFVGNAVDGGTAVHQFKWGIAIHNSHYGLIRENVVYNMGGAGIMFEDGSESFNLLDTNFVVRTQGLGPRETGTNATEGVNYYFRGPNNYVRNNVGANALENLHDVEAAYFMKYNFVYLGNVDIPNFRGADTSVSGQYTTRNGNRMAVLENVGNEGYGGMQGFTNWWTCSLSGGNEGNCDQNPDKPSGRSEFKNMKLWHFTRYPYYGYPQQNVTFSGWYIRGDRSPAVFPSCCQQVFWGDYATFNLIVKDADIQGIRNFTLPYWAGGITRVENSLIGTRFGAGIQVSQAPGACPGCFLPKRRQVFRNVRFLPWPGQGLRTIGMSASHDGSADLVTQDQTVVCDHDGTAGDNFQFYYREQNPNATLAADSGNVRGCPGGSMSNQQCRSQHGKSFVDELAPCTTERPSNSGLTGYVCVTELSTSVCASGGSELPPGPPSNLRRSP